MIMSGLLWRRRRDATLTLMKPRVVVIAIVALLVGLGIGWTVRGYLAIDACLDAGGGWQIAGGYCTGVDRERAGPSDS